MSKLSPQRLVRAVDLFQQHHAPFVFVFAVVKKFGDDQAGSLAALLTYYSFLSIFPLLLVLVTLLGLVAGHNGRVLNDIFHSALAQFPVIGNKTGPESLADNIHRLRASSPVGLTIGLLGLVWGSLGASQAGIYAMGQVWNIPLVERPGFVPRLLRSLLLLLVLGIFLAASTTLTGIATIAGAPSFAARSGGVAVSAIVNLGLFLSAFRILTPHQVRARDLVPGAVIGALGWTMLQAVGAYLVGHELRHASQIYGFFGYVLGLLWWIYLAMQLTLYAAEINVVRSRKLWPRSMVQPPLTPADQEMLDTYMREARRRPEQRVPAGMRRPRGESRSSYEPLR